MIIGTRGSKLARAQAEIIAGKLRSVNPGLTIEIKYIVTSGDKDQKSTLSEIGGKGTFIRELEQALLDKSIDMAVHSFKDVTSNLAPGLMLASFRTPESVCDVLVTRDGVSFENLPSGAHIGTGSIRRKTLLTRLRSDLVISEVRGNIDTRIGKVDNGEFDGIMLSEAGLIRLGINRVSTRFDPSHFYPAPGQGVITIETRSDDATACALARSAGDEKQFIISTAELSLLTTIGFDCKTPLGVYSHLSGTSLSMLGFFVDEQTNSFTECSITGDSAHPETIGRDLASKLLAGRSR